ncbi:uncharacterized protein C8orf58 homolog isoform X2 [Parus major]|uniref:uncharacterized protein C8orf58 homolog isoform X2 n=1 Tax=Parus major TaxID=9157 RepID=UPI0014442A43|nr:uncharacterized protein C8orf58 homolog isoform X2 [Parus major]
MMMVQPPPGKREINALSAHGTTQLGLGANGRPPHPRPAPQLCRPPALPHKAPEEQPLSSQPGSQCSLLGSRYIPKMLHRRGAFTVWPIRGDLDGPWESAESCIVRTSASVYRRLQESPWQPPRGMSSRGPPSPPPQPPSSPSAGRRFLKFESEDSGVEMASNEHSPSTPLGSESSFSLDGFPAEKPPGEEPPRSRSASRRLLQAAQRSRRQRCPRQLSRRSASTADLAEPPRDPGEPEGAAGGARQPGSPRDPRAGPEAAVSGQGLRYLEHVCQMLERLARLQQDNRALRQQAAGARSARPATLPTRQSPRQNLGTWRGEEFRPRSCSDSQAPAEPGPCRRMWGHSLSSPSLLDPSEGGARVPAPDKVRPGCNGGRVPRVPTTDPTSPGRTGARTGAG